MVHPMHPNRSVQAHRSVHRAPDHNVHGAPGEVRHPGMLHGSQLSHLLAHQCMRLVSVREVRRQQELQLLGVQGHR